MLLSGTFGTIAAYLTGDAAGEGMEEGLLEKAIGMYEEAAIITLWLAIATSLVYRAILFFKYEQKWSKIICILLFAALVRSVARKAYLGGQLVYKQVAGVKVGLPNFNALDSE